MTNVIPRLSGSVTATPIAASPDKSQSKDTCPEWKTSGNILPVPLNGCSSLLIVKLARHPEKPEIKTDTLIIYAFYS